MPADHWVSALPQFSRPQQNIPIRFSLTTVPSVIGPIGLLVQTRDKRQPLVRETEEKRTERQPRGRQSGPLDALAVYLGRR